MTPFPKRARKKSTVCFNDYLSCCGNIQINVEDELIDFMILANIYSYDFNRKYMIVFEKSIYDKYKDAKKCDVQLNLSAFRLIEYGMNENNQHEVDISVIETEEELDMISYVVDMIKTRSTKENKLFRAKEKLRLFVHNMFFDRNDK